MWCGLLHMLSLFPFLVVSDLNASESANTDCDSGVVTDEAGLTSCVKTGPYLCTGYDVYMSREPCVM